MGIYIRGMEMPTSCLRGECPIDGEYCGLWEEKHWKSPDEPYRKRHPKCPLIHVPPHGRLIDADALTKQVEKWLPLDPSKREEKNIPFETDVCVSMLMAIEEAPTIIEADYPPSVPLEQVWTELFGEDGE